MDFHNARYCNGFPTLRRNSDMLGVSIYSILSDIFLFVPVFSGHKNGHSRRGGADQFPILSLFPRTYRGGSVIS